MCLQQTAVGVTKFRSFTYTDNLTKKLLNMKKISSKFLRKKINTRFRFPEVQVQNGRGGITETTGTDPTNTTVTVLTTVSSLYRR